MARLGIPSVTEAGPGVGTWRCKIKRLILVAAVLISLAPLAGAQTQRGKELPPLSGEIPNWVRIDTSQVAVGPAALSDWLGAVGQVFLDHGFMEAWRQAYEGPGQTDSLRWVWIFDLADSAHCAAAYHDPRSGEGIPWIAPGHPGWEARIDTTARNGSTIDFWRGKFFCRVEINAKSDTALAVAKRFARAMSDKIRLAAVEENPSGTRSALPFGFTSVRRNPTQGGCLVEFALPASGWVRVSVYDAQGRFLRELVQGTLSIGKHRIYWDGKDGDGVPAGAGVYFLRLVTEERSASAKLVVIR